MIASESDPSSDIHNDASSDLFHCLIDILDDGPMTDTDYVMNYNHLLVIWQAYPLFLAPMVAMTANILPNLSNPVSLHLCGLYRS